MLKDKLVKHYFLIFGSVAALCLIYFCNLGAAPLLDSDETRYADMARYMLNSRDYVTLWLDGRIFWDKPPLYFWLECLSFTLLGKVNEFSVRLPSVLCAISSIAVVFWSVKKTISTKAALVSAAILATSVEFVIFARVSILDMVLTSCITVSVFSGMLTYFVKEENKKYFWLLFYGFSAFGMLAKGIPAAVVPFGTMFFIGLWKKNIKEFFKPEYLIPGGLLFLLIALPWHVMMYKIHGAEFIQEYIVKHHFQRFVGSSEIGRCHSFIYFVPTFLIGFLPWSFSFLFGLKGVKLKNDFVTMNLIGFVFTFLFFSTAQTKLITYILPLYPFAAVVCAYIWLNKKVDYSIYLTNGIFFLFGILVLSSSLWLPEELYGMIKPVQIPLGLIFLASSCFIKKERAFVSYLVLVAFLSGFMMPKLFGIWFDFGQKDLMYFANYAKSQSLPLAAYNVWERFSLQYYYNGDIEYILDGKAYGAKYVQTTKFDNSFNGKPTVIRKKDLAKVGKKLRYRTIMEGVKYDLIEEVS